MYRIMLVDDEVFVVDGLYSYLQRHMADEVEVVRAYGSEEALDHARQMRLDLVISDINMPGMDGFGLLKRFTGSWPACRFIFLTGHANFDYAYRALQHGSARFLLKSEGYARLAEVIRETLSLVDANRQAALPGAQERQSPVFGRYIKALLRGETAEAPGGFRPAEPMLCVMAELESTRGDSGDSARIEAYAQQLFQVTAHGFSWPLDDRHIAWMIQPAVPLAPEDYRGWQRVGRFTKGMVDALQTLCVEGLECTVSFALTDHPMPTVDLPIGLTVLEKLLDVRRDDEKTGPQLWVLHNGFPHTLADGVLRGRYWAILQALSGEDAPALERAARGLEDADSPPLRQCLSESIAVYGARAGVETLAASALLHLTPVQMLVHAHREMLAARRIPGDPHERILEAIRAYIEENLHSQLTLTEIAEHIHMNPSYLSRYYKKRCGINLFDYITSRRIQRAKQMLRAERMKISDIAMAVGFSSLGYFSSTFRKAAGSTPQDYRRTHQRQEGGGCR